MKKADHTKPSGKTRQKATHGDLRTMSGPSSCLQKAETFLRNRDCSMAAVELQAVGSSFPFDDALLNGRFLRCLAFVEAHAGHLGDAEFMATLGQLLFPHALDFPFVLCSTKLRLKDYVEAKFAGNRFIALRESMRGQAVPNDILNSTGGQAAEIYFWLGVAYKQTGDPDSARESFELAISIDPGAQAPYLEYATMLKSLGQTDQAQSVIECGLAASRDISELRLLADAFKAHPTISACMIVKNEEELLPACLDSIRSWVDEIIIVDTGSSDQTVAIAESYGAKVFHQAWEGNFSKPRNYSLELATSDWIFIIDADERMVESDIASTKKLLAEPGYAAIAVSVFNVYEGKQAETFLPSIRFFRRSLNLRYDGIVHNTLVYPSDLPIARANIRLRHLGYGLNDAKMRQKLDRTKELLRKQLAENPHHAFAWFNLAQALRGEAAAFDDDTSSEVIEAAHKALCLTQPDDPATRHIHLMALDQLAWANFGRGAYDNALSFAQQALLHKPNYLDPLLLVGHIYARRQQFDDAERAYLRYLDVQSHYDAAKEIDNIIFLHVDSRSTALFALGAIAEMKTETAKAIDFYHRTIACNPKHLDVHERLARLQLSEGRLVDAEASFSEHLRHHPDSIDSRLGLAYIEWATTNHQAAEKFYLEILDLDPSHFQALEKLCRLYQESGRQAELKTTLSRVCALAKEAPGRERDTASLNFACGDFDEAARWFEKAILLHPGDAQLLNDLGNCHFKLSQFSRAIDCYRQALDLTSAENITWRNLALAQAGAGDFIGASESMESYTSLNSDDKDSLLILAEMYRRAGRFEAAISCFEKYLLIHPAESPAIYGLAETYLVMGHRDSALMGYRRVVQLDPDCRPAKRRIEELSAAKTTV